MKLKRIKKLITGREINVCFKAFLYHKKATEEKEKGKKK
jgi:hypothetical protein